MPLYSIDLIMMKFSSKLFVGLAFDSGGVTGAALTSAFLTTLTLGVAQAIDLTSGNEIQTVLTNGFGIIAFISVTSLIEVQALGLIYSIRVKAARKIMKATELAEFEELTGYT